MPEVIACERSSRTCAAIASSSVSTIPPSPTASCFLEKNDRQATSPPRRVDAEALGGVLDQREPVLGAQRAQSPVAAG